MTPRTARCADPRHPDNWSYFMRPMTEIDLDSIILKLLNQQAKYDEFADSLDSVGLEINFQLDLIDTVLDLLGAPQDESPDHDDAYCRDWLYNIWLEVKYNPVRFVSLVKCALENDETDERDPD